MNSVTLVGRLTKDPDLSYTTTSNTARCTFTVAVDRPRKNGEDQGADFIRVVVWGKQAESSGRYLSKGRQVAVEGSIRTGSYENSAGTRVYTTDVWANRVEFLGGKNDSNAGADRRYGDATAEMGLEAFENLPDSFSAAEDDTPF